MISLEIQNSVALLRLNHGVTNPINLALVNELKDLLSQISENQQIISLVLTSSNDKFFSIGFDIPALYDLPMEEFKVFYQAFNCLCLDLYTLPKPFPVSI